MERQAEEKNNETLGTEQIDFQIPNKKITNSNNNDENPNLKKNVQSQQPNHVCNTNPTPIYNNYNNRNSDCCDPLTDFLCIDCFLDCWSCCKIQIILILMLLLIRIFYLRYDCSLF